jgi:hypothetical protein
VSAEVTENPAGSNTSITRRTLLAGLGAATTAAWVAPTILTESAAAASSSLATVTLGVFTHHSGNATKSVELPSGTFTKYLLVVSEVDKSTGPGALPVLTSGAFSLVTSSTTTPAPNFAVYESTSTTPGTPSFTDPSNGRWTAVVIGFTVGSTVTNGAITSGTGGTININGATAPTASTWIAVGSASIGAAANNWATITGYTTLLDVSGNNNTPPDLLVARANVLSTSVGAIGSQSYGPVTETAKAVQIGVG